MNVAMLRGSGVGLVLMVLGAGGLACNERGLNAFDDGGASGLGGTTGSGNGTGGVGADGWQAVPMLGARKVDLLIMVDNSQSMAPLQAKLTAGFPALITALQASPAGAPDLHIAVISSDTGPGKYDLPERGCSFRGDNGSFQYNPRGTCAISPLFPGQTFLQVVNGVPSYKGSLSDAFACIAALGDRGCGFEGQLKSVRWALDPVSAPAVNQGFLRPEALLAVVLITNEDDCSVPDDGDLADPLQMLMSDPLGPFNSFRCNEFGHLCQINGQLTPPPRAAAQGLMSCISNDTSTGKLTKVTDEVQFLKSLKSDPNQIFVAAVTGPATPYNINLVAQVAPPVEMVPAVQHSCQLNSGEYADPAVRIAQWVQAFGSNGLLTSICGDSMTPALQSIGQAIGSRVETTCINGPFLYSGGSTQPDCRLADTLPSTTGDIGRQLIPNCLDSGGMGPCWTLVDDSQCAGDRKLLTIDRAGTPPSNFGTELNCTPCPSNQVGVGCPTQPHQQPDGSARP